MLKNFQSLNAQEKINEIKQLLNEIKNELPKRYTAEDERFLNNKGIYNTAQANAFLEDCNLSPQILEYRDAVTYSNDLCEENNILNALARHFQSTKLSMSLSGDQRDISRILKKESGHCVEQTLLLEYKLWKKFNNINTKVASLTFYNHSFLIIDDTIIADPWDDKVYTIDQLSAELNDLPLKQKHTNVFGSVITFFGKTPARNQYDIVKENNNHKPVQQIVNTFCTII